MTRFNSDIEFIHPSGQVFCSSGDLTLRPDSSQTRSVIIGSGASLRPEQGNTTNLGTSDLKWKSLFSHSGVIGGVTIDIDGVNVQDQVTFEGDTIFNGVSMSLINGGSFSSDSGSSFTFNGTTDIFGQLTLRTDIDVLIDAAYQIGNADNRWATIHAASGVFNVLTPPESGTYIQVNGSLSPSQDALYVLGGEAGTDVSTPSRWADVYAASGHFNAIYPQASGTGVPGNPDLWIELGGSLIPNLAQAELFWFGTGKFNRHAGVDVVSGLFTQMTAATGTITSDLTVAGDLTVGGGDIDLTNAATTTINSNDVDWTTTAGSDFTTDFDTWDFQGAHRPTTNGSGMAMEAENYFEVYAGRNVAIANPVTSLQLYVTNDGAAITPGDYFFTVSEDVQLRHYTIETVHLDSNPAPWAIRLRIEGRDNDHASGIFNFGPTGPAEFTYRGSLSGTQTIPGGSRCRIIVDADGAAGHNTAFAKVWLGMTVVSGLVGQQD